MNSTAKFILPVVACALGIGAASAQTYDANYGRGNGYGWGYGRDAGTGPYVGLNLGALRYNEDGLNTITPVTALVSVGLPLSPYLAIEGRAGGGLGSASSDGYGLDVRSVFAGYVRGMLPLAPGFSLYGLGGVAAVDLRRDFGIGDTHDTGFSFGVGADFAVYGGTHINIEWTRLATGNNLGYDYSVDMASIGAAWHF